MLDVSFLVIQDNEITNFKRPVKKNDEVVEEIAQNILGCQRYGDTSDTQARNDGANVVSEIIKKENKSQRPDNDIQQKHYSTQLFYFFFAVPLPSHIRL